MDNKKILIVDDGELFKRRLFRIFPGKPSCCNKVSDILSVWIILIQLDKK